MSSHKQECAICLDEIDDKAQIDGCTHNFCMDCIKLWSKTSNTCPMCKKAFSQIERFGARTLSSVQSNGRVTRSQVDKDATIEVQRRVQERSFDFDELIRLGILAEEIAAQLGEIDENENEYDTNDGWCVSDDSSSSSSSSGSSRQVARRRHVVRRSPRVANRIDLTSDNESDGEIQVTVTRRSKRARTK